MLPSAFKDRFQTLPDNTRGAAILMLAAFFFAVMTLIVKILGERLHVTQILFVRQIVMTAIVMPMKSGRIVERRDQVLIGFLSFEATAFSTFA